MWFGRNIKRKRERERRGKTKTRGWEGGKKKRRERGEGEVDARPDAAPSSPVPVTDARVAGAGVSS